MRHRRGLWVAAVVPLLVDVVIVPAHSAAVAADVMTVRASAGDRSALVEWTPPVSAAGVSGYRVESVPATASVDVPASRTSVVFPGLSDGTSYRFRVTVSTGGSAE